MIDDQKFCPVSGLQVPSKDLSFEKKLDDMSEHLDWAQKNVEQLTMNHEPCPLNIIISEVLAKVSHDKVMRVRRRNMAWFRKMLRSTAQEKWEVLSSLDEHVRDVLSSVGDEPVNIPMLELLSRELKYEDGPSTNNDIKNGFPLIGHIPTVSSAKEHSVRCPLKTESEVRSLASNVFRKTVRKPKVTKENCSHFEKVFDQTIAEVKAKRMSDLKEVSCDDHNKRSFPVTGRFPVLQTTSTGAPKVRPVDDFAKSLINDLTKVDGKISVGRVSDIVHTAEVLVRNGVTCLSFLKADFKSAYRICPIKMAHLKWADTVVFCPRTGKFFLSKQYSMPFGAVGAVYAWDRVADMLTYYLSVLLLLPLSRFVDDLFCCIPTRDAKIVRHMMVEVVHSLGFVLDPDKTPVPGPRQIILGVDVLYQKTERRGVTSHSVKVRVDPLKAQFWLSIVRECIRDNCLTPDLAAKMAGRLGFISFAVLGPLGANRIFHLYKRVYDQSDNQVDLTPELLEEMTWWCVYLTKNNLVTLPLDDRKEPAILMTDAEGDGRIGAVLSVNDQVSWFRNRAVKPKGLVDRKTQIIPFEALAVKQALAKFKHRLLCRKLVLFVDNQSVLGALRKGRSRAPDVHLILREILTSQESGQIRIYPYWVPSALNIADGPSRGHALPFGREV